MTQISRPFQVAIALVALLGVIWVFALRGHSSNPSHSASSRPASHAAAPAPKPSHPAASSTSKIYHGAAPGVQGLTRAIAKAHEAVNTSQANAKKLEQESEKASSVNGAPASSSAAASAPAATKAKSGAPTAPAKPTTPAKPTSAAASGAPARQRAVESELAHGRVVAILFWNRNAADDAFVHGELQLLAKVHRKLAPYRSNKKVQHLLKIFGLELTKPIAVHEVAGNQVASFGNITSGVQVLGTPTLLIIGPKGKTISLTGLQDAASIEQTIDEVRHATK